MRQTLHSGRQVLRRRAFRRFWLGMLISRAGDAVTLVALSWLVLDIAGPAQLGVVLMCFGLPRMATVLYPQYCRTFLHAGPTGYGVLVSAAGAGALLGVLAAPGLSRT